LSKFSIGAKIEMMEKQKTILISLGGAIICPEPGQIDAGFLKKFRLLILKYLKLNYRFVIVAGGGQTCRFYQEAAKKIVKVLDDDLDWIGIHATRINAHLLRTIFRNVAYPVILDDPHKPIKNHWQVIIGAGWRPGCSSDTDSVLLAKRFGAKEIINASNTPYVYNKDFRKYKDAKPIKEIHWQDYRKLIDSKWTPGMKAPFDPIASKEAQKSKIRVFIIKGTDIENFEKLLAKKNFVGTIIEP
jgi:uridylate kinase